MGKKFHKKYQIEIPAEILYDCRMSEMVFSGLSGSVLYFVGIKGTGMTALAEIFRNRGAIVTGSDVEDKFYTDQILEELGIPVFEGFDESNLPDSAELLIHSAAYSPDSHPEILKALERGMPVMSYAEALGIISQEPKAAGIAGVHGKTTTTAIAGTIMKEFDLPGSVLTGSSAANFGGRSTWVNGSSYFIAETCEYKRHFLNFHPDYLVITSIEADHLDYYRDYEDVLSAFIEYADRLPKAGTVIYCADDEGACEAAGIIGGKRKDLRLIPYGFDAEGDCRIADYEKLSGEQRFRITGFGDRTFILRVPGLHNVRNSTAAAALINCLLDDEGYSGERAAGIAAGLLNFRGTKRRSEIIGEASGILVMDDYGHHPAAIKTTIAGLRDFYPDRRIIVDFMSHTYSRTEALLDDFAASFGDADKVILHKIYASAREAEGNITGRNLFEKAAALHGSVEYFEEVMDAWDYLRNTLKPCDLFVTMGAGDNWKLGYRLFKSLKENEEGCNE